MLKPTGQIQDISYRLCETFKRLVPLDVPKPRGGKRPSKGEIAATTAAALDKFYEAASSERKRHALGIIGKARVAIRLQQLLLEAGYPSPLVKQVLFAMLTSAFVGDAR